MNIFLSGKFLALFGTNGSLGCVGLILIAGFIALLFWRRKKIEKGVSEFYQKHGLNFESNPPLSVLENLGNANWQCFVGELETDPGKYLPFYWWRGYTTSMISNGKTMQTSYDYFLAVSFAPGQVSEDFQQKVRQLADKRNRSFGEKIKNFFVLDTKTPMRVENLADGSFLIVWHSLDRADIYEEKINWLRLNLAPAPVVETMENIISPVIETPSRLEKISSAEIRRSAPLEQRAEIEVLMRVLDSMNRDYHDTKAHPAMTLEDHANDLGLDQEQTDFVKRSLHLTTYTPEDLKKRGFDLPEVNSYPNEAVDVVFPHRKMTYLTAQDIYLDFEEPHRIYVYQK